jgi:DNA-binding CsgD family transcriptional regulator
MRRYGFYFIPVLLSIQLSVTAQEILNTKTWVSQFERVSSQVMGITSFYDSLAKLPLPFREKIISAVEDKHPKSSEIFLLNAIHTQRASTIRNGMNWKQWAQLCLKERAKKLVDNIFFQALLLSGDGYQAEQNYDTCVFYLVKAVEVGKQLGYDPKDLAGPSILASHGLFNTKNYEQCIAYCRYALQHSNGLDQSGIIAALNNLGMSYQKTGKYDSAILIYRQNAEFAKKNNNMVWWSITIGNIGDALYEAGKENEALPYWQTDVDTCIKYNELLNAYLSRAYINQHEFRMGEKEKALKQLREAFWFSRNRSRTNELVISRLLANFYEELNNKDSANWYSYFHKHLDDSLNFVISRNNYSYIQLKLDFEKKEQQAALLKKEKNAEVLKRNILLASLAVLILLAILLYNRLQLKIKLARQQQQLAAAETEAAKKQLELFTQTLLQKNEQIETLSRSLQLQPSNTDELIHQTLLTEDDWMRFKELFEKIHPFFFSKLKQKNPAITTAEIRLAALIRLGLDNKQMASMQGISLSGLRATKSRLRQKMNISADQDLDEIIKSL